MSDASSPLSSPAPSSLFREPSPQHALNTAQNEGRDRSIVPSSYPPERESLMGASASWAPFRVNVAPLPSFQPQSFLQQREDGFMPSGPLTIGGAPLSPHIHLNLHQGDFEVVQPLNLNQASSPALDSLFG